MSANSRRAKRRVFEQLESRCLLSAGPPDAWEIRGIGGGGAMFAPSFSPHDDQMYVVSDMSNLFQSDDLGASWQMHSSDSIRVNREHYVRFTSDPDVLYMSGFRGTQWGHLAHKSTDGGATWAPMTGPAIDSYALFADYDNPQRVVVGTWNAMYLSSDGGGSWARKYQTDDQDRGLHLAGAFFDDDQIFLATNKGLLVSTNGGGDFSVSDVGGIPEGEGYMSFAGAKVGNTRRFFAVTSDTHLFNGILAEGRYDRFANVYVIDWGQNAWSRTATQLSSPVAFVEMAHNNIDIAYLAGKHQWWYPHVYKTTDGGASWSNTFQYFQNANVQTGWLGDGGKFGWGWAGPPVGLAVSPTDANKVATTDYMSFHVSTDGGDSWRQTYTSPPHAAGEPVSASETYQSIGLEVTSAWDLTWATPDQLIASYTDISGLRSDDGGASWSFDYTGHTLNTMYHSLQHSNGNLYAATSSVHDLYIWGWTADSRVDGYANNSEGHVLYSTDNGKNWQMLFDADNPVIWLAEDPNNVNRLYASVVHSQHGGIYRSDNIQADQASTWTRLAAPPRTQGHPLTIQVLNDGTLVCTYGAHSLTDWGNDFQPRSGVFVSTDGGQTWIDRSDPNMLYWTWDLVVDPHDPAQNTWYVGVWNGGGEAAGKGGLYRTEDRGQTWTRPVAGHSVHSVTISPTDRDVMVYTTAGQGLWYTANATAANPAFTRVDSFPFAHPTRVFHNPHEANEIWVTTFGNGMYVGRTDHPFDVNGDGVVSPLDVLLIINEINRHGPRQLPPFSADNQHLHRLDVSKDGVLSALDALLVINYLNQRSDGQVSPASMGEGEPMDWKSPETAMASRPMTLDSGPAVVAGDPVAPFRPLDAVHRQVSGWISKHDESAWRQPEAPPAPPQERLARDRVLSGDSDDLLDLILLDDKWLRSGRLMDLADVDANFATWA